MGWLDRKIAYWSLHFDKYEPRITILFAVALSIYLTTLSILATTRESEMTPIYVGVMIISFWLALVCGFLLIRNTSRKGTNRRLSAMENKLDTVIERLDTLIDEIRQERNERKDTEH